MLLAAYLYTYPRWKMHRGQRLTAIQVESSMQLMLLNGGYASSPTELAFKQFGCCRHNIWQWCHHDTTKYFGRHAFPMKTGEGGAALRAGPAHQGMQQYYSVVPDKHTSCVAIFHTGLRWLCHSNGWKMSTHALHIAKSFPIITATFPDLMPRMGLL